MMKRTTSLCLLAITICLPALAEDPTDTVRRMIAAIRDQDQSKLTALTLKTAAANPAGFISAGKGDDCLWRTWCVASKVDGNAAVVSLVHIHDNGSLDPDPCFLVKVAGDWLVVPERTTIDRAEGIVSGDVMESLRRVSTWYKEEHPSDSHLLAAVEKARETHDSDEKLRLLVAAFSKHDPKGFPTSKMRSQDRVISSSGMNLFHAVIITNSASMAALVGRGLDVNMRNTSPTNTDTLLVFAVRHGAVETVKLLLKHGADVDGRSETGKTALFQAARDGHLAIARALVEAGANVNAPDRSSNTPLYEAISAQHVEMVKFLIDNGSDSKHRNSDGRTMADIARERGTPAIQSLVK